jgi:hypothetical protein
MSSDLPRFVPVKGTKFVRDMENGAILNTDINELNSYKFKKQIRDNELKEKEEMRQKIQTLENNIEDIKNMLTELSKRG